MSNQSENTNYLQKSLKALDDESLLIMAGKIEKDLDDDTIEMLLYIPQKDIEASINAQKNGKKSQIFFGMEYIFARLPYIQILEREMDKRKLLNIFRENMLYIDYEKYEIVHYGTYQERLIHLLYLKIKGFITDKNIKTAEKEIKKQLNAIKAENSESDNNETDTPDSLEPHIMA